MQDDIVEAVRQSEQMEVENAHHSTARGSADIDVLEQLANEWTSKEQVEINLMQARALRDKFGKLKPAVELIDQVLCLD